MPQECASKRFVWEMNRWVLGIATCCILCLLAIGGVSCNKKSKDEMKSAKKSVGESPVGARSKIMTMEEWKRFLEDWSREVLSLLERDDPQDLSDLARDALRLRTLLYDGVSEQELISLEKRLGRVLPESYKRFLRTSNGFRVIALDAEDGKLFSTAEIEWFRLKSPQSIRGWMSGRGAFPRVPDNAYFVYGEEQDPINLRDEYLESALQISEEVDAAVLLLNPEVIEPSGEWEAWYFGYELPGANRYRTFQNLMVALRKETVENLREALGQ